MGLSAMMALSLPHLTILTKCDLIEDKELLEKYLKFNEDLDYFPYDKSEFIKKHIEEQEDDLEEETDKRVLIKEHDIF